MVERFARRGRRGRGAGGRAAVDPRAGGRRGRAAGTGGGHGPRRKARQADGRVRGRLLLGRPGGVPARQGRGRARRRVTRAARPTPRNTISSARATPGTPSRSGSRSIPRRFQFGQLLQVFFSVAHDPTELNRQGPDAGTQYRSALFFTDPAQKRVADAYVAQLDRARSFHGRIVTEVAPLKAFYPAEAYHQNYADASSRQSVHRHQRRAEGRTPAPDVSRALSLALPASGERRRGLPTAPEERTTAPRARRWPPPSPTPAGHRPPRSER